MALGWQVRPELVVTQGERSLGALEALREFFGCGEIYRNSRHDNHREDVLEWCVRRRQDLEERVVPFFGSGTVLLTAKAQDFGFFCEVLALMRDAGT